VGECFFWYRPTWVVPDQRPLNGVRACVRACVRDCVYPFVCACVHACMRACVRAFSDCVQFYGHITGTKFSLELSANVVHREVELCAPTSLRRTRDKRRHGRQTAAVVTVVRKYPRKLSCSNPVILLAQSVQESKW